MFRLIVLLGALLSLVGCEDLKVDSFDPEAEYREFVQRQRQQQADAKSSSGGEQTAVVAKDPVAAGKEKFLQFCVACHGPDGKGNSPAAMALNPRPRDLTAADWQAKVDDKHIYTVVEKGGTAVGLSASMAAWGGVLSAADINNVVAFVRSLKGT